MKRLLVILEKEFRQVFRQPGDPAHGAGDAGDTIAGIPFAANYEVKNVLLSVVDHDHSAYSQKFISKITSSGYFKLTDYSPSYDECEGKRWKKTRPT